MRITVCELPGPGQGLDEAWTALAEEAAGSDLVVLPEMPFAAWLPASREVDPRAWARAAKDHDAWQARLPELGATVVAGSRPVVTSTGRYNEAFVWDATGGYRGVHRKTYLPDEAGFWEAHWYSRGPTRFEPVDTAAGRLGFLVCSELWFLQHAREFASAGVEVLVCPRVTPTASADRWLACGRVASACAGAFGVSSNRSGAEAATAGSPGVRFAGLGWVVDPDGDVLATTSPAAPAVTVEVDRAAAGAAKRTYPRYLDTAPIGTRERLLLPPV